MNKTYVYDGQEVRLTGRTASKRVPPRETKVKTSRRRNEDTPTSPRVVEIESVPDGSGASSWKKWVRETDLYRVDTETQPDLLEEN
jgi:hypothetical protein